MSEVESVKQEPQFAAFIGIDCADKKTSVVLASCEIGEAGERKEGLKPHAFRPQDPECIGAGGGIRTPKSFRDSRS